MTTLKASMTPSLIVSILPPRMHLQRTIERWVSQFRNCLIAHISSVKEQGVRELVRERDGHHASRDFAETTGSDVT